MNFIRSKIQPSFMVIVDEKLASIKVEVISSTQNFSKRMTLQVVAEQFKLNKLDVDLPEETEKSSSSDDE